MAANEIIPSTFTTSPSPIVYSYTSGGDQLRDGNHTETGWSSNSGDQWLRADLGSSQYVDYVCILPWHSGAWSQNNLNDANCYLEHSNDGTSWTVHSQITGVEAYTYRRIAVGVTARYWRIHSTTGYGACGDFRFFDVDPALDTDEVAATFKCVGRLVYGGGAAGPCFRDGVYNDPGSVWASDNLEASLVADLGVAKMVKTIKIAPGTAGSWSVLSNTADGLTLDYSSDGSSWTTVATVSGATNGAYTSYSPNISARYWRLHTFDTYKSVGDFRFYTDPSSAPITNSCFI